MALPKRSVIPTKQVDFDGEKVEVRGLTRNEAKRIADVANSAPEYCDVIAIALGCDVTEAEAEEWLNTASLDDSTKLVHAILELSGLTDDTPKDSKEPSSEEK